MKHIMKPNFTQIPNVILDNMSELSHSQFKVLMYICRRTYGFQKDKDRIALSQMLNGVKNAEGVQLDTGTGLSKQGLLNALNYLEENKYIVVNKTTKTNTYQVNLFDYPNKQLVNSVDQTSQLSRPKVVNSVDLQKKEKESIQKKDSEQVAYNQKEYIENMRNSDKPINKIIGIYLSQQDVSLPTKEIAQATFKRHLRAAKNLLPWTENEQGKELLMKAFEFCKKDSKENKYVYTLETVYKHLTK